MAGVSNIRKLNTVRFKTENFICYIQYENVGALDLNVLTEHAILRLLGSTVQQKDPE